MAKINIKPLADRVLIEPAMAEEKTAGGIIIPDTAKEKPQKGKVIAVGKGKTLKNGQKVAPDVKEGNIVLFGKYSGDEFKIDGEECLILDEDDILAIL